MLDICNKSYSDESIINSDEERIIIALHNQRGIWSILEEAIPDCGKDYVGLTYYSKMQSIHKEIMRLNDDEVEYAIESKNLSTRNFHF